MRTENAGKKLSPRREAFAAEYLKDLNATRAAIRAGYSAKTASSIGARLLADAGVARAVEAGMAARARRTEIDASPVNHDWKYDPASRPIRKPHRVQDKAGDGDLHFLFRHPSLCGK